MPSLPDTPRLITLEEWETLCNRVELLQKKVDELEKYAGMPAEKPRAPSKKRK